MQIMLAENKGVKVMESAYLDISVAQSQPISFVQCGCVLQDFHYSQQVTTVLCPFIGGESQARNDLCEPIYALPHLRFGNVVP